MSLGSSVAGRIVGASSAAIGVPIGLLVTLGVVAAITGGGGFGGLDQLTRGPEIPGVEASAPPVAPFDGGFPALPATPSRSAAAARRAARARGRASARRTTTRRRTDRPAARTPSRTTPPTTTAPATTPATAASPTTPSTSTSTGPAKPATRPNPLREIVRTVQGVVTTVPAVGPPVADAVGTVADLILPPLPGSRVSQGQ